MHKAIKYVFFDRRLAADRLGEYPNLSAASSILALVSCLTFADLLRLKTRAAVALDVFASFATSTSVGDFFIGWLMER